MLYKVNREKIKIPHQIWRGWFIWGVYSQWQQAITPLHLKDTPLLVLYL